MVSKMMYAKIIDEKVATYPYLIAALRREYPNVSFPSPLTEEVLADFDVFLVQPTPQPAFRWYQRIEETTPKKINGEWVQQWQVINVGTDDRNALVLREWQRLREMRNDKLSNTDWTQLPDSPVDKSAWASYRQALRDLPSVTHNPFEVVWPEEPE
jgi:hypothetical protein